MTMPTFPCPCGKEHLHHGCDPVPIVCLPSLGEECGNCHRCTPPKYAAGGRIDGPSLPMLLPDPHEQTMTAAEVQAFAPPDLTFWRFALPEQCDHPVTVTKPLSVVRAIPGDPFNAQVIVTTTDPVTYCFECHQLVPTPPDPWQEPAP